MKEKQPATEMRIRTGAFVRGLWGEADGSPHSTAGHKNSTRSVRRSRKYPYPLDPLLVYVWGEKNLDYVRGKGYDPILVSPNPVENYSGGDGPRSSQASGGEKGKHQINWGISFWRQKLECIRMGLLNYPAVIWLDWDTTQIQPLPDNFWQRMAEGQPVQAGLRQYKRAQCPWREHGRGQIPHGAFLYCRELRLVERAIEFHATKCPTCTDEVAWALVIEEMMGGWTKDYRDYHRLGFEPFCYDQRRIWRQFFPCREPLFLNIGRY